MLASSQNRPAVAPATNPVLRSQPVNSAASSAALQQPPFGAPLVGGGGSGVLPKARTGGPAGSSAQPAKLPPKSRVASLAITGGDTGPRPRHG